MLLGIAGKMGAGKTLSMSILSSYISRQTGVPLYSNYSLKGSLPIQNTKQLWELDGGIVAWDEIHVTMDSRSWKNNVFLTHFITQTRKKKLLLMYTTQHIGQVDIRVRQNTDVLIYADRRREGVWLQFVDYQYKTLGRRFLLAEPQRFYNLYDTYKTIQPVKYVREADEEPENEGRRRYFG